MTQTPPKTQVLPPSKLAHVVLRTNRYEPMKAYYKAFLGAHAVYENDMGSFLAYDEEHHRVAIINAAHLSDKPQDANGLEHFAFSFDSLEDLCLAYKQRKSLDITPGWCTVCSIVRSPVSAFSHLAHRTTVPPHRCTIVILTATKLKLRWTTSLRLNRRRR